MKKIILVVLVFTGMVSCKPKNQNKYAWTPAYELKAYTDMDNAIKPRMADDAKRKLFVNYIVAHLKAELPNGLESVSADSINKLSIKIGKEYTFAHADQLSLKSVPTRWTADVEQSLRDGILHEWPKDDLKTGNKFCDCAIRQLKKIYPDSVIIPLMPEVAQKVGGECRNEVKK